MYVESYYYYYYYTTTATAAAAAKFIQEAQLLTDDFGGISISPVLSKVFEHCVLRRFESFVTSDNRSGFKKRLCCLHAIFTVRSAINHYTSHLVLENGAR